MRRPRTNSALVPEPDGPVNIEMKSVDHVRRNIERIDRLQGLLQKSNPLFVVRFISAAADPLLKPAV